MAGAVQFDGQGRLEFPSSLVASHGDEWLLRIGGMSIVSGNLSCLRDGLGSSDNILLSRNLDSFRWRNNNGGNLDVPAAMSLNDVFPISVFSGINDITTNQVRLEYDLVGSGGQKTNSTGVTIAFFGDVFTGIIFDEIEWQNFTTGDHRRYSMQGNPGDNEVIDLEGGPSATLVDFVTGGFIPAGFNITSPVNNQFQVADGSNQSDFTVAGDAPQGEVIEYRTVDLDGTQSAWTTLTTAVVGDIYSGTVTVTGQQTIEVRQQSTPATVESVLATAAKHVVLWWGQSDAYGRATNLQTLTIDPLKPYPLMERQGLFLQASDPTNYDNDNANGSHLIPFLQAAHDAGETIGVINVANPGTQISQWLKGTANYTRITNAYNSVGGFTAGMSLMGFADANAGVPTATLITDWTQQYDDFQSDFGLTNNLITFGTLKTDSPEVDVKPVKDAYMHLIQNDARCFYGGSNEDIDIASAIPGNDGLHIKSDADNQTAGIIRHNALNGDYAATPASFNPVGGDTVVNITWDAVPGATGYKTWIDGVFRDEGNVTSTQYTGLTNGTSYEFYAVAYGPFNTVTSDGPPTLQIDVTPTDTPVTPPVVTLDPVNTAVTEPAQFTLTSSANNADSSQWYKDGSPVAGETGNDLTRNPSEVADSGAYFNRFTNAGGFTDTAIATVTVSAAQNPPVITQQPSPVTVTEPAPVTLTSAATGAVSSQWYKDSSPVAGETGDTLTINPSATTDSGNYFNRYTASDTSTTDTNTVAVVVNAAPPPSGFPNNIVATSVSFK